MEKKDSIKEGQDKEKKSSTKYANLGTGAAWGYLGRYPQAGDTWDWEVLHLITVGL